MNQKNSLGLNSCFMDLDDPLELFKIWMTEAEKKEIRDPTSSSLATTVKNWPVTTAFTSTTTASTTATFGCP